jgi:putative transposase
MIDQAIAELAPVVGTTAACAAVGRARATHYRWRRKSPPRPRPAPKPHALACWHPSKYPGP